MVRNTEVMPRRERAFAKVIRGENDRGRVLVAGGLLEEQLKGLLLAFMVKGKQSEDLLEGVNAPIGTFSSRIAACFTLGLIDKDEHHDLTIIRKIRNEFAHEIDVSFATPAIASRCKALRAGFGDDPAELFINAVWTVMVRFIQRPHHIEKYRCKSVEWPGFDVRIPAID